MKLVDGGVVYQRRSRRRPAFARWLVLTLSTAALLGSGVWLATEQHKAEQATAYYPQ